MSANQLYIMLILILKFSQDPGFCDHAHQRVILPYLSLFKERLVQDISLGKLLLKGNTSLFTKSLHVQDLQYI